MIQKKNAVLSLILLALVACSKPAYEFVGPVEPPQYPNGAKTTPDSRVRMATRGYLASALKDIFGSSAVPTVDRLITSQIIAFGGEPCDPNAETCSESGGASQLPPVPFASPMRMALMNRACQEIVSNDAALVTAMRAARAQAVLAGVIAASTPMTNQTAPSNGDISSAFELFYTGRPLTDDVAQALRALVDEARARGMNAADQWRVLLGTLCESPGWQIP